MGKKKSSRNSDAAAVADGVRAQGADALPLRRVRRQDPRGGQGPDAALRGHPVAGPVGGAGHQGRAGGRGHGRPGEAPPPPAQGHGQERRPLLPQARQVRRGCRGADAAATVQELLARLHLQQQPVHVHHGHPVHAAGAWNALPHDGYGQPAYPWLLQQQHQAPPPEPYLASYPVAAAYPTASWGAYAAYPHDGRGGAYGGGGRPTAGSEPNGGEQSTNR